MLQHGTAVRKKLLFSGGSSLGLIAKTVPCATTSDPIVTRECADWKATGKPRGRGHKANDCCPQFRSGHGARLYLLRTS